MTTSQCAAALIARFVLCDAVEDISPLPFQELLVSSSSSSSSDIDHFLIWGWGGGGAARLWSALGLNDGGSGLEGADESGWKLWYFPCNWANTGSHSIVLVSINSVMRP